MKGIEMNGEIVVTKNAAGQIVAVTRQDEEGRILSVLAESEPAAVAVPDALIADARRLAYVADQVRALEPKGSESDVYLTEAAHVFRACADRITALAATPAAAPVVLPEPVTWLIERSAFHVSPHGQDAESNEWLEEAHEPGEEGSFPVYTEQQVRALHGFTAFNQWLNYRLTPQPGAFLILGD